MTDDELRDALREHAYLEGDFVLRSGKRSRYYLDKYRFETRPDTLAELGKRIAQEVADVAPHALRLAAPELGGVVLATATSLASGLPFVIVRGEAKSYGTANRLEGAFEPGESLCMVEDIVTSGGALVEAIEALREAGLIVTEAVCVVDREEGGARALEAVGVRLHALFRATDIVAKPKTAAKPHG